MKKKIKHETLYDFANACPCCREPVVSYWQGYALGYSIGHIHHKDNCEKVKNDRKVGEAIHKQLIKSGYKY